MGAYGASERFVEMLQSTLSKILGESASAELARGVKATACSFPEVLGVYDLVVSLSAPDRAQAFAQALGEVQAAYPDYAFIAVMDTDFAEE